MVALPGSGRFGFPFFQGKVPHGLLSGSGSSPGTLAFQPALPVCTCTRVLCAACGATVVTGSPEASGKMLQVVPPFPSSSDFRTLHSETASLVFPGLAQGLVVLHVCFPGVPRSFYLVTTVVL